MKQRIGVDMDGVIADLMTVWVNLYNEEFDDSLTVDDIILWNWHPLTKNATGDRLYRLLDDPNIFESLPVIEHSQEVLQELSKKYELVICTAPYNLNNVIPKANWLKKNFPFIDEKNYVFTRNKGLLNADWLIDDKAENFEGFSGTPLLYTAAHNKNIDGLIRMDNWLEIREWFLG